MNLILAIPLEARMAVLFVLGAVLGSLANWATYRLAFVPRAISPWSAADPKAPPRSWFDRVPIFGWLGLWRELPLHGRGFWIRPMLVELAAAFALVWLYQWEVVEAALLPAALPHRLPEAWQAPLHIQFAAHTVLIWFMLVATLIDLDEMTIPDPITVPGTLIGLLVMSLFPLAALPNWTRLVPLGELPADWTPMTLGSPNAAPLWPGGFPVVWPLVAGLGCWALWCFGLLRRDWYTRHGLRRAMQLCLARLARDPSTVWIAVGGVVGGVLIALRWWIGGPGWTSLLSALVGMAVAASLTWAVRLIGGAVMRCEVMGFGDVTLTAMIGAFVGWQASVFIFFLAPLFAVGIGIVRYMVCRNREIPYGPFLCLAALLIILRWDAVWDWAWEMFRPGWLVPCMLVVCAVLLGVLLSIWQMIKWVLFRGR